MLRYFQGDLTDRGRGVGGGCGVVETIGNAFGEAIQLTNNVKILYSSRFWLPP